MAAVDLGPVVTAATQAHSSLFQDVKIHEQAPGSAGLPTGFPGVLDSELAWTGQQFMHKSDYVHYLTEPEVRELEAALQHFKSHGLDGDLVNPANFPLPQLSARLDAVSRDLHDGKGFGVIRGLDPRKYSVEDLTILHLGIQGYIANRQGRQDKKGNMMVHIVADKTSKVKGHHRHSTAPITFHTEETGDIVSWLTRSKATAGGKCIIASAYTVYNVLAASRPDMIRTLARSDWPFSMPKFQCRPIIFYDGTRLIMNFGRAPLLGNAAHPRKPSLPTVSPRQVEALEAIEAIAQATQMEFQTEAGDLHFINNLAVLHRREGFVNGSGAAQKRHLVRMRLRDDQRGWPIPAALQKDWSKAFEEEGDKIYHLEPMPEGFFPLRCNPN